MTAGAAAATPRRLDFWYRTLLHTLRSPAGRGRILSATATPGRTSTVAVLAATAGGGPPRPSLPRRVYSHMVASSVGSVSPRALGVSLSLCTAWARCPGCCFFPAGLGCPRVLGAVGGAHRARLPSALGVSTSSGRPRFFLERDCVLVALFGRPPVVRNVQYGCFGLSPPACPCCYSHAGR